MGDHHTDLSPRSHASAHPRGVAWPNPKRAQATAGELRGHSRCEQDHGQPHRPALGKYRRVEGEADSRKEKRDQQFRNTRGHCMHPLVRRFRKGHSREERPDDRGHTCVDRNQRQTEQQRHGNRELGFRQLDSRTHLRHDPPDGVMSPEKHKHRKADCQHCRQNEFRPVGVALRIAGNQRENNQPQDIVDHRGGQDDLARIRRDQVHGRQYFRSNHNAGGDHCGRNEDRLLRVSQPPKRDAANKHERKRDAAYRNGNGAQSDIQQVRRFDFQADAEEEKHNSEFRKRADHIVRADPVEHVRTNDQPRKDFPCDSGLFHSFEQFSQQLGRDEYDQHRKGYFGGAAGRGTDHSPMEPQGSCASPTLKIVQPLSFLEARALVLREVGARRAARPSEVVPLIESAGRILAEDAVTDRDAPPFHRSARDGFAVRANEIPGVLRVIGEVRAGELFAGRVEAGQAVEIMTGAPVPDGADAVVMVEHCQRRDDGTIFTDRTIEAGANIAPRGSEASRGSVVLPRGTRVDYTAVNWLAANGSARIRVFTRPTVAILATGDELVDVERQPESWQIRNSNAWSLAAQVSRAGGLPLVLPVAPDLQEPTRELIERGLRTDLLLLSGGVSAGRYDVVELALAELGAEFFFDRVRIQPGQPVVFGHVRGTFFFGLPGNPGSTIVTFELFARAALELLSGASEAPLPLTLARLTAPFRHKPGLTRFLPARVECGEITPIPWQGSGDVPALCRANAFLVADADRAEYAAGDTIPVIFK